MTVWGHSAASQPWWSQPFSFSIKGNASNWKRFFTVWVTDKNNLWSFLYHNQEWNIKGSNIWGLSASGRRSQMDVNREGMWQVYKKQTKMQEWDCRKAKTTKQKSPGKMVNWKQWLSDLTSPVPYFGSAFMSWKKISNMFTKSFSKLVIYIIYISCIKTCHNELASIILFLCMKWQIVSSSLPLGLWIGKSRLGMRGFYMNNLSLITQFFANEECRVALRCFSD